MRLTYREPRIDEGLRLHQMVLQSAALDVNSSYLYGLLATHFASTVVLAEMPDGELAGFVSAYRLPQAPEILFVWQIAVAPASRGQGIASRLLHEFTTRPWWPEIRAVQCTITPENTASQKLFGRWAERLGAALTRQPGFSAEQLGMGHAPEDLFVFQMPERASH